MCICVYFSCVPVFVCWCISKQITSSGSVSLNSQPSPVQEMNCWQDLSVNNSSRNCQSWIGPEPYNLVCDFNSIEISKPTAFSIRAIQNLFSRSQALHVSLPGSPQAVSLVSSAGPLPYPGRKKNMFRFLLIFRLMHITNMYKTLYSYIYNHRELEHKSFYKKCLYTRISLAIRPYI